MTVRDYVIAQLATLIWNEPHDDSLQGMLAAGLVVRNRVIAGWEGGDWLRLIAAHDRYAATEPKPGKPNLGDVNNPLFRRVLGTADSVYSGLEKDITQGALYYANLNNITRDWFRDSIVRNPDAHPRIAQIGKQQFFK